MTRDDEDPRRVSARGRRRLARSRRSSGIGRTGARFPSAQEFDPDLDDADGSDASLADAPESFDSADAPGPTGARFGSYSARTLKSSDIGDPSAGSTRGELPDDVHDRRLDLSPHPSLDRPPRPDLLSDPTPFGSAERTEQMIKPWSGALVRPYAHTGGRTRTNRHDLAIEALVESRGRTRASAAALTTNHRRMIVDLCTQARSVAEVAALLSVPLGVARVLLDDLATAGAIYVHPTASTSGDGAPDVDFMSRVLAGLRRL